MSYIDVETKLCIYWDEENQILPPVPLFTYLFSFTCFSVTVIYSKDLKLYKQTLSLTSETIQNSYGVFFFVNLEHVFVC